MGGFDFSEFSLDFSKTVGVRHYAITRQNQHSSGGDSWAWEVHMSRQGVHIKRTFSDAIYGGELASLTMAKAYRDALIRLIPPQSQRQRSSRLNSRNLSGISGVSRVLNKGRVYWKASLNNAEGQQKSKFLSVKRYGEEKAKEFAIQAREELLQQHPDYFMTRDALAIEVAQLAFSDYLHPQSMPVIEPLQLLTQDQLQWRLAELNRWFDALRPLQVHVSLRVHGRFGPRPTLRLHVRDGGLPARMRVAPAHFSRRRVFADLIHFLWTRAEVFLTELHGPQCWVEFAERFHDAFFGLQIDQRLFVRYRYDPPEADSLRQVPPSLDG